MADRGGGNRGRQGRHHHQTGDTEESLRGRSEVGAADTEQFEEHAHDQTGRRDLRPGAVSQDSVDESPGVASNMRQSPIGRDWQVVFGGGSPVVVDSDDGVARLVEQRRGDGGAVAGSAMHPHLSVGDLVEAALQIVKGDVHGAVDVAVGPFVVSSDIEDGDMAVDSGIGQFRE
jgi:hypothetical protein